MQAVGGGTLIKMEPKGFDGSLCCFECWFHWRKQLSKLTELNSLGWLISLYVNYIAVNKRKSFITKFFKIELIICTPRHHLIHGLIRTHEPVKHEDVLITE